MSRARYKKSTCTSRARYNMRRARYKKSTWTSRARIKESDSDELSPIEETDTDKTSTTEESDMNEPRPTHEERSYNDQLINGEPILPLRSNKKEVLFYISLIIVMPCE